MFPTSPKPSRMRLPSLLAGFALAILTQLAGAQTLPEIQGLMKQGRMSQALEKIDLYIAAQPRDAQGPFTKGLILTEMGRPEDAIAVFTGLTENFPELPEPYNNLAVLYAGQGQYDKARTALEGAIRANPGYATAQENLGDVYLRLAAQAYGTALQLDTSSKTVPPKLAGVRSLLAPAADAATNAATNAGTRPAPPDLR